MKDQDQKKLTRREMIKAGGILAVGLAYSKPLVKTVQAEPAFKTYWDKSSIEITRAKCINGEVEFTICNVGDGDMTAEHEWRLYRKQGGTYTQERSGTFSLPGKSAVCLDIPYGLNPPDNAPIYANGDTIKLEADQAPTKPGNPVVKEVINCNDL